METAARVAKDKFPLPLVVSAWPLVPSADGSVQITLLAILAGALIVTEFAPLAGASSKAISPVSPALGVPKSKELEISVVNAPLLGVTEPIGPGEVRSADPLAVVQLKEPAVDPAVKTLPLLVVLVAGTCRLPSPVGWA